MKSVRNKFQNNSINSSAVDVFIYLCCGCLLELPACLIHITCDLLEQVLGPRHLNNEAGDWSEVLAQD